MAELIATPCHPKANSYVTYQELEDALSVFDWWESLTPLRKKNAAILAASAIDAVPFIGRKLLLGQRMQFPRTGHPVIKLSGNILKFVNDYWATGYTVESAVSNVTFDLDIFPTELEIHYEIGGNNYVAVMLDDGTISGDYCSGFCYKDAGTVELNFSTSPDVGSLIQYFGDGYYRRAIQADPLKADPEKFLEGFLNYGSVRFVGEGVSFLSVITDSIPYDGTIEFEDKLPRKPEKNESFYVIAPIHEDIKIAQLIQTAHIIDPSGTFPIEGIRIKKVGDTLVSFTDRILGYSRYVRMASRFGLHPAAFTRLVPYTIYGEITLGVA